MTQPSQDGAFPRLRRDAEASEAWDQYMALCADYLKRQLIVYQNWPQRKWAPTGYRPGKVFSDQNN